MAGLDARVAATHSNGEETPQGLLTGHCWPTSVRRELNLSKLMKLSPTAERFVLHWGEMGARWGMNRTVSQIHALLYF